MSENARIYGPESWRVAVFYAALSVLFTLLLVVFPGLRRFPLPSGNVFPIAALTLAIPLATLVWGGIVFVRRTNPQEGRLAAMSLIVGGMCFAAVAYICWNEFFR